MDNANTAEAINLNFIHKVGRRDVVDLRTGSEVTRYFGSATSKFELRAFRLVTQFVGVLVGSFFVSKLDFV